MSSENKLLLTWDEADKQIIDLYKKIKSSKYKPDKIIVLPRGGYYVTGMVSRALGIDNSKLLQVSVSLYKENKKGKIQFGQIPTINEVRGQKLLILDDIWDSGTTIINIKKKLREFQPADIKSAVIHFKPGNNEYDEKPDYFSAETDRWIEYPWETSRSKLTYIK